MLHYPVCVCVHSHARLFAAPLTVAHQAPLSMGFSSIILEQVAISFSRASSWTQELKQHVLHWQVDALPLCLLGSPALPWLLLKSERKNVSVQRWRTLILPFSGLCCSRQPSIGWLKKWEERSFFSSFIFSFRAAVKLWTVTQSPSHVNNSQCGVSVISTPLRKTWGVFEVGVLVCPVPLFWVHLGGSCPFDFWGLLPQAGGSSLVGNWWSSLHSAVCTSGRSFVLTRRSH